MMKRMGLIIGILVIIAGIAVGWALSGSNSKETAVKDHQQQGSQAATSSTRSDKKSLIIYFSLSGNTKEAATQIQKMTGADVVRLQPKTPYPDGYNNIVRVARSQFKRGVHPAIKRNIPNLARYDTIFVGFPTWWQQPPMIIHTLFDDYDFSGKNIIPFTTSMSTPMSASMPYMKKLANADNAKLGSGFRYDDNPSALRSFLKKNKLH